MERQLSRFLVCVSGVMIIILLGCYVYLMMPFVSEDELLIIDTVQAPNHSQIVLTQMREYGLLGGYFVFLLVRSTDAITWYYIDHDDFYWWRGTLAPAAESDDFTLWRGKRMIGQLRLDKDELLLYGRGRISRGHKLDDTSRLGRMIKNYNWGDRNGDRNGAAASFGDEVRRP